MASKGRSEDVKTPEGIASFTKDLFELRTSDTGKKSYGFTMLFDKATSLAPLEKAVVDAITSEWGDKAIQMFKDGLIKTPFLDGDSKQGMSTKTGQRHPGYAGRKFIRCTSGPDFKPKVFDRKRNPVMDISGIPSGSRCVAVVNAYCWDNVKNGKGVSFGVSLIQVVKVAEGDEILGGSGGPDPDKFFEAIADEGGAPDSTKTGSGAAGLFS